MKCHFYKFVLLLTLFLVLKGSQDDLTLSQTNHLKYESFISSHKYNTREILTKAELKKLPKKDRPDLAIEQDYLMTVDPSTGSVPRDRALTAYQKTKFNFQNRNILQRAIADVEWEERGPNNVGGRTRAIAYDLNDNNRMKVWAGGVSGGLWFNNDISDEHSQWQRVDDFWSNIAISTISIDPQNKNNIYVGTGEGFYNYDALRGGGIWKSNNGGQTWQHIASTTDDANLEDFVYVQKVFVRSNGDILAATRGRYINRGGIMRSTNGGDTWEKVLAPMDNIGPEGNLVHNNRFYDWAVDIEEATNGDLYATFGIYSEGKIFRSTDNGDTWLDVTPENNGSRIEIAIAPSQSNTTETTILYAVASTPYWVSSGSEDVQWIKKSTDGGQTWNDIVIPPYYEQNCTPSNTKHFTRGQAWYNLALAVHPTNPDIVVMGGIDLFQTQDGGQNWELISYWTGRCNKPNVHADQHAIIFNDVNNNEIIVANDGGVYLGSNIGTNQSPSFKVRNNGYNITQFYSCAALNEIGSNYFLAGTQDNGTQRFSAEGINSTQEVTGGDGGFCFIDQDQSSLQITSYVQNNYYLSTNGGQNFGYINLGALSTKGRFINPADYDNQTNTLFSAGNKNELIKISGIGGNLSVSEFRLNFRDKLSAIRANTYTDGRIFVGTGGGRVFSVDQVDGNRPRIREISRNLRAFGYVSSIDLGTSDDEMIVTLSNYGVKSVWYTTDGGSRWTCKDENGHGLPDIPVRWALFNPENTKQVLLATEVGVWSTDDITANNPEWEATNEGLANVRCDMLKYRTSDKMVVIATHGRGLYTTDVFSAPVPNFEAERTEWFANKPLQFEDLSLMALDWAWDFNNDGIIDSELQHPSHTFSEPGIYTVTLHINGRGFNETKESYIQIHPEPSIPYFADFENNGQGFYPYALVGDDKGWEYGAASSENYNAALNTATIEGIASWVTDLDAQHAFGVTQVLETPPFSFTDLEGKYLLEFDYRALFADFAGFYMEYSLDEGDTWSVLGQEDDQNGENWYNENSIIPNENVPGWRHPRVIRTYHPTFDLNQLLGEEEVRFRFVFTVENQWGNLSDGVQLDNFKIHGPIAPPNELPELTININTSVDEGNQIVIGEQKISANDPDGENGNLTFTLVSISQNGDLYLADNVLQVGDVFTQNDISQNQLSYEHSGSETIEDQFEFTVTDENGGQIGAFIHNIDINSLNDNPTVQVNEVLEVLEGESGTINNLKLWANDVDGDNQTLMFIFSHLPTFGSLYKNNVRLNLNDSFTGSDLENGIVRYTHNGSENFDDAFEFEVVDQDGGSSGHALFSIEVTPVNDAPTAEVTGTLVVTQNEEKQIPENLITVDDSDDQADDLRIVVTTLPNLGVVMANEMAIHLGESFTYSDLLSGRVEYKNDELGNGQDEFSFKVVDAQNAETPIKTLGVRIQVGNPPTNILLSNNSIEENKSANSYIGTLSAVDIDENDDYAFELLSGDGFKIIDNKVYSTAKFNYEIKNQYSIEVRVTDSQGNEFSKELTIQIDNSGDAPSDIVLSNNTIEENKNIGVVIGDFSVADEDQNESFIFEFNSSQSNDNQFFRIKNNQLISNDVFNFEEKKTYQIRVEATDKDGLSTSESFEINIEDVNDNPSDIQLSSNLLPENSIGSYNVAELTVLDSDLNDSHTFSISNSSKNKQSFTIENNQLLAVKPFNFEEVSEVELILKVVDNNGASFEKNITIQITDQNDAPTQLSATNNVIAENLPAGMVIGYLNVTDEDREDRHTFKLINVDEVGEFIRISGGQMILRKSLNFEEIKNLKLVVEASDKGQQTITQNILLEVIDQNDAPTNLVLSNNTIDENVEQKTLIGTLEVEDEDINDKHQFILRADTFAQQHISIEGNKVYAIKAFNYEKLNSLSFSVEVKDRNNEKLVREFYLQINDQNDAPTDLLVTEHEVVEGIGVETVISNLKVIDEDVNEDYTFTLSGDDADWVVVENGQIILKKELDFESKEALNFTISVEDILGRKIKKNITIQVRDKNEPPRLDLISEITLNEEEGLEVERAIKVSDPETEADELVVVVLPQNQAIISSSDIHASEEGEERDLNIIKASRAGITKVIVSVFDGELTSSGTIDVKVNARPRIKSIPEFYACANDNVYTLDVDSLVSDIDHTFEQLSLNIRVDSLSSQLSGEELVTSYSFDRKTVYLNTNATSVGVMKLTLIAKDPLNASSERSFYINIKAPVKPSFEKAPLCEEFAFEFTDNTILNQDAVAAVMWDFDNNGTFEAEGFTAVHAFLRPGRFRVGQKIFTENGCSGVTYSYINIADLPTVTIDQIGYRLEALASNNSQQLNWYLDGKLLEDVDSIPEIHYAKLPGVYTVGAVNANGCETLSEPVVIDKENQETEDISSLLTIFPNPARESLTIKLGYMIQKEPLKVRISNMSGAIVFDGNDDKEFGFYQKKVNVSNLPTGTYAIRLEFDDKVATQLFNIY